MKIAAAFSALVFFGLFLAPVSRAAETNYVTPVFPLRGQQYWRQGSDLAYFDSLYSLVEKTGISSTWLVHYDVLKHPEIAPKLITLPNSEIGLFLEVTRALANDSFVSFNWESGSWSQANKIFLSSYTRPERQRLIDTAFTAFKTTFGNFPKSYGAWYVDVWSMEYILEKYGAEINLGLADQYSTDGYQTWGQYINLPYFVSKKSAIEPALDDTDSTRVLKLQWAPRHPVLAYGLSVDHSNFSAQVNDYHRAKNLSEDYFQNLLKDITVNVPGKISQAVIGIEVGELENQYMPQLAAQLKIIKDLESSGQIKNVTMSEFNRQYRNIFPSVSPEHTITAIHDDTTVTWFMSPRLRYGIRETQNGKQYFDLRFYHRSGYRDNDQILPDYRANLVRLVPAEIDGLVLKNTTESASLTPPPSAVTMAGDGAYGSYAGRFGWLKSPIVKLAAFIPDLVYSNIEGHRYFGLRTGFTTFVGIRFPDLKIGAFTFDFSVLKNFISLKQKLTPNFSWDGKQEIELRPFKNLGRVFEKGKNYGQDELLKSAGSKKLFENSYYTVFSDLP